MRINVDMDGVLAKYLFEVPYEGLFEEHYFLDLPPQPNILEAVKQLSEIDDVYILSSYLAESKYAYEEKRQWLRRWLPEVPESHWKLIPYGSSKGDYIDEPGDILMDDYGVNCRDWASVGGKVCKVSSCSADYWKEKVNYEYIINPEMSPSEIVEIIGRLINA